MTLTRVRRLPLTKTERSFFANVNRSGPVPEHRPELGPCWLWLGWRDDREYGYFWDGQRRRRVAAYRFSYELFVGPIPPGKEPDHLCRVHACVRWSHLEAVTHRENLLRSTNHVAHQAQQTHCIHGHPLSGSNLYVRKDGRGRQCRTCYITRRRESRMTA